MTPPTTLGQSSRLHTPTPLEILSAVGFGRAEYAFRPLDARKIRIHASPGTARLVVAAVSYGHAVPKDLSEGCRWRPDKQKKASLLWEGTVLQCFRTHERYQFAETPGSVIIQQPRGAERPDPVRIITFSPFRSAFIWLIVVRTIRESPKFINRLVACRRYIR